MLYCIGNKTQYLERYGEWMKRKFIVSLLIAGISCGLVGCGENAAQENEKQTGTNNGSVVNLMENIDKSGVAEGSDANEEVENMDVFCADTIDFSIELLQENVASGETNVMVSPVSVLTALAMTANGAEGETLSQMQQVIGENQTLDQMNQNMKAWTDGLVNTEDTALKTKYMINAAGIYSDHIAKMAGDTSFFVHPRRGEYILLDKECGSLVSHTIFRTPSKMGKGILVTPTVDGNLLTGPTSVDIEDKEDTSTTAEGFQKIMELAKDSVSSIPFNKTITSFCGLRSVGSTGDFVINAPKKGFINVAAIESPGLTSAPAIAEYVVELLKEQGAKLLKKDNYSPLRESQHAFREADMEEKNEMIKKDKTFGKIVCRCETISEGEILQAIRTNPGARDLDGVKRRTRAQMGRCQGGFCGPQIVEILSRELGIPYEDVTKSGEGSHLNIGRTKEV